MPSAIVLSLNKFSDTGNILHLYTAEHGRMQYVVYGNKYKGILRPLSIIDFTTTRRNNAPNQLATIATCQLSNIHPITSSNNSLIINCISMFIAEVLANTLRHPLSDQPLFDWLCDLIQHLHQDTDIQNIHLEFLIHFATLLGIGIDDTVHPDWFIAPHSRIERQKRLQDLCTYYQQHIEDFRQPKSLDVLMEVFD